MAHPSDSSAQRLAERHVLAALEATLPASFASDSSLPLDLGTKPDGVDPSRKVVVEVFARLGKLKPAQQHKVKGDLFKLAYIRQQLGPEWQAVFCFADDAAAASTLGRGWHAQAARAFGIQIMVVDLPQEVRDAVMAAQLAQRMVNA